MKRRGFIKTGLITMAAGAKGPSAFGEIIAPLGENISSAEIESFAKELDLSMERISYASGNYLKKLVNGPSTENKEIFFRSALRSLLLIGNFGDLPVRGQAHPWMQKRMIYSAPETAYAVTSSLDILKNMSSVSMEEIHSTLTEDAGLGERILETLDLEAGLIGVPYHRRRQMRVMGTRIVRRLKHSPEMFINEYVRKAEKLIDKGGPDADYEHIMKVQMGEKEYAEVLAKAEGAAILWKKMGIPDMPVGYNLIIAEGEQKDAERKKKNALTLLGIALVTTGIGWLILLMTGITYEGAGILGLILGTTVGPILILIALISLIILGARSRKQDK